MKPANIASRMKTLADHSMIAPHGTPRCQRCGDISADHFCYPCREARLTLILKGYSLAEIDRMGECTPARCGDHEHETTLLFEYNGDGFTITGFTMHMAA